MENKNNITALIDYLYGNLSQKEKEAFEENLKNDPALRKEVEELKTARKGLASLGDHEIMDPYIFQAGNGNRFWNKPQGRPLTAVLKYSTAIAASVIILFLAGFTTKATLHFEKGSVTLSFGNRQELQQPLTRDDVSGMIREEVTRNNRELIGQINSSQASLQTMIEEHNKKEAGEMKELLTNYTNAKNDEIQAVIARLQDNNRDIVNEYIRQASAQQRDYIQNLMVNFSDYLQKQRTQDLEKIRTSLVTLKQSQEQQTMQTSQILTSLISSMNSQNN